MLMTLLVVRILVNMNSLTLKHFIVFIHSLNYGGGGDLVTMSEFSHVGVFIPFFSTSFF